MEPRFNRVMDKKKDNSTQTTKRLGYMQSTVVLPKTKLLEEYNLRKTIYKA